MRGLRKRQDKMVHSKPAPLFIQVSETIKARMDSGEYKPGDFLPSHKDIADELGISLITVRKAMDLLVAEGRVVSKQGVRATVVEPSEEPIEIEINKGYSHWIEMAKGKNQRHEFEFLDRTVIRCPGPLRKVLNLTSKAQVERFRRVFSLRDKPIVYLVNYARDDLAARISTEELLATSFMESFQKCVGLEFRKMEQRIQAVTADIDLGRILKTNFGSPLVYVQNRYFGTGEHPVALSYMHYLGSHFVYTIKRYLNQD